MVAKLFSTDIEKAHDLTILKHRETFRQVSKKYSETSAIKQKTGGNLHLFDLIAPSLGLRTGIFAPSDRKLDVR